MSELRLAGSLISWSDPPNLDYGHLQLVFVRDDGKQEEIEVVGPNSLGAWAFAPVRDHTSKDNTAEYTQENKPEYGEEYRFTKVLDGASANSAWDVLKKAHEQFSAEASIAYNGEQNSNSYATTLLKVIGLDDPTIVAKVIQATPEFVKEFPGFGTDVLANPDDAISLDLVGSDKRDVIHTGVKDDTLSGLAGDDELSGGGGDDTLNGGPDNDILHGGPDSNPINVDIMIGGAGKDEFVASTGSDIIKDFDPNEDSLLKLPEDTKGWFNAWANTTVLTYSDGTIALEGVDLRSYAEKYPGVKWDDGDSSSPPQITAHDTFQEGDLIFLSLNYTDPDGDAEGFGFRGVKGSGWAEETHPFSDPSYGRVSDGAIAYPFNHLATTDQAYESDVEAWIYDKEGLRSDPVTVHLAGDSSELDPIGGTAM